MSVNMHAKAWIRAAEEFNAAKDRAPDAQTRKECAMLTFVALTVATGYEEAGDMTDGQYAKVVNRLHEAMSLQVHIS